MPDVVEVFGIVITSIFFFWASYNAPLVLVGLKSFSNEGCNTSDNSRASSRRWPRVSIIVPVKSEEKVIERLLKALVSLTYPNKEVIVVEDGSTDRTGEICRKFVEKYPSIIRYYHRDVSEGKPSALNFAVQRATGEIIAIYDADTIVEPDVIERILPHFNDPEVAVVQGQVYTINPKQSLWARVSALNDFLLHIAQLGKYRLGLFVVGQGNHMYFRRSALEELGFWDPQALAEDLEISVRFMKRGYKVKYVTIRAGIEAPFNLRGLFKQRLRWFRGYLQALGKHKDILCPSSIKEFDALITMLTPVFLVLSLPGFVFGLWYVTSYLGQSLGLALLLIGVLGPNAIALARPKSFIYIPLLYLNWVVQALAATYACVHALLRRKMSWIKTEKQGAITEVDFSIISSRQSVS
jgi:cellulose synthase/poly-beta-1,6-N-acetylglucosamine synthase-like glycosyltransferase